MKEGVFVGLLLLCLLTSVTVPVDAFYSSGPISWNNGLSISAVVESLDFWVTGTSCSVYLTLTLLDAGTVVEFERLTTAVYVYTEEVDTSIIENDNPWNAPEDQIRVVHSFILTSEQINNAGLIMYTGHFYYQINLTARVDDGSTHTFYTQIRGPGTLNLSTEPIAVLWPYPPIIIALSGYWLGFLGLRRFNRRYEGLDELYSSKPSEDSAESP